MSLLSLEKSDEGPKVVHYINPPICIAWIKYGLQNGIDQKTMKYKYQKANANLATTKDFRPLRIVWF